MCVLPWCHLASFTLNYKMSYETRSCPVTGATVYVSHAGLQVDFAFADHCVAPTRSSLMPDNGYLSCSSPLLSFVVCTSIAVVTFFVNGFWLHFYAVGVGVGVGVEVGVALPDGVGVGVGVVLPVRSQTWALLNTISVGTLSS